MLDGACACASEKDPASLISIMRAYDLVFPGRSRNKISRCDVVGGILPGLYPGL